ncbi:MAG TPA: DUF4097 family beta strand repeat-containing protein [Woeseiaceae bacterium]|nr:DUF4097 family beta strand repeat-containing protein [Woeseiaceae bacterium]
MKVTVKILLAAGLTVLLAEAAAAELVERRLEAPRDAIISVQNTAGAIDIRGWSRNEVEVRGDLGRDVEELVLERDDREIRIEVRASRRNNRRISSDLDIRVPEGSTVNVSGVSTNIDIADISGDLRISVVSGDVDVSGFGSDIEVGTVSGDIQAGGRGQTGDARFNTVSGDVDVQDVSGNISIESVSGDLLIADGVFERVNLNTTSGDVVFKAGFAGNGRFDLDTINGDSDLTFKGDVSARFNIETFNGEIRNCFGPEPVRTSQYTPGRELKFTEGGGSGRVTISTLNGDLRLCKD